MRRTIRAGTFATTVLGGLAASDFRESNDLSEALDDNLGRPFALCELDGRAERGRGERLLWYSNALLVESSNVSVPKRKAFSPIEALRL